MDHDDEKIKKARQRKKRKALSRIRKTLAKSKDLSDLDAFSEWETEFAESLEERLETFDSAFRDPQKGRLDAALSYAQAFKLKEIEDKAKGKKPKRWMQRGGFKKKTKPARTTHLDEPEDTPTPEAAAQPIAPPRPTGPPVLTVISGGKNKQ